jgi:hypothetical protein
VGGGFDGALTSLMSKIPGIIFSPTWAGLVVRTGDGGGGNPRIVLLENLKEAATRAAEVTWEVKRLLK